MQEKNIGTVVQVIGPVLDIRFPDGHLPDLLNAIEIERDGGKLVCEVAQQHRRRRGPLHRHELHRRPGARHGGRRHRRAHQASPSATRRLGRVFNLLGQRHRQ